MSPWIPFDADIDEVEELHLVRERIPPLLRGVVKNWVAEMATASYGNVARKTVDLVQSALRVDLSLGAENYFDSQAFVDAIQETGGDKLLLRVVDLFVGSQSRDMFAPVGEMPERVQDLARHLDLTGSAISVVRVGEGFRLAERLPQGVEFAAEEAANAADATAGRHLAQAWDALNQLEPDAERAFTEGIKAVELASYRVVLPDAKKVRLSQVVQALKDKQDWRLVLERREDGHPDHRAVLIGMLETLALSQSGRHGGNGNTVAEAKAHVMLASLLVGWFATGAVVMEP